MFSNIFRRSKKKTEEDKLQRLYDLIKNLLDEEYKDVVLTPETSLEELGFNSIKYIHLFLSLEDVINAELDQIMIRVQQRDIKKIKDIQNFIEHFTD